MNVGDLFEGPRQGRRYRVLRFIADGMNDVVLWDETFKVEERAVSALMTPENGWKQLCSVCKCPPGGCCPCGCHEHASRQDAARRLELVLAEHWVPGERARSYLRVVVPEGHEIIGHFHELDEGSPATALDGLRADVARLGQKALAMMLTVEQHNSCDPCPVCGVLFNDGRPHHETCAWGAIIAAARALG